MNMNIDGQMSLWFVSNSNHWVQLPLVSQIPRPRSEAIWVGFIEVTMEVSDHDLQRLQINRKTPLLKKVKTVSSLKLGLRVLSVTVSFANREKDHLSISAKDLDSKEVFETIVKSSFIFENRSSLSSLEPRPQELNNPFASPSIEAWKAEDIEKLIDVRYGEDASSHISSSKNGLEVVRWKANGASSRRILQESIDKEVICSESIHSRFRQLLLHLKVAKKPLFPISVDRNGIPGKLVNDTNNKQSTINNSTTAESEYCIIVGDQTLGRWYPATKMEFAALILQTFTRKYALAWRAMYIIKSNMAAIKVQSIVRGRLLSAKAVEEQRIRKAGKLLAVFGTLPGSTGWYQAQDRRYMDQASKLVIFCRALQNAQDGGVDWTVEHGPYYEPDILELIKQAKLKIENGISETCYAPLPGTLNGTSGAYIDYLGHVHMISENFDNSQWTNSTLPDPQAILIQKKNPLSEDSPTVMVSWMFTKFGETGWYIDKKCESVAWCSQNDLIEGCNTWDIEFGPYKSQYILKQMKLARILLSKGELGKINLEDVEGQKNSCHISHTGRIMEGRVSLMPDRKPGPVELSEVQEAVVIQNSGGLMIPWGSTITGEDGWYLEKKPEDSSDIIIWRRKRQNEWDIEYGPFPLSLIINLIDEARKSQNEENGNGINLAPLPCTQYGESGKYISAEGDIAKYLVVSRGNVAQNSLVCDWIKINPSHEISASIIARQARRRRQNKEYIIPVFRTKSTDKEGWFLNRLTNHFGWYEQADGVIGTALSLKYGPFQVKDVLRALNESKKRQRRGDENLLVSLKPIEESGDFILVDYAGNVKHEKSFSAERIQEGFRQRKNKNQQLRPIFRTSMDDKFGWFLNKPENQFGWYEATSVGRKLIYGPFEPKSFFLALNESKARKQSGEHMISVRMTPVLKKYSKTLGDDIYVDFTGNVTHAKTAAASMIQEQQRKRKLRKDELIPVLGTRPSDPEGWFLHKPSKLFAWYHTHPPPLGMQVKFGPCEPKVVMQAMRESQSLKKNGARHYLVLLKSIPKMAKAVYVDYSGNIHDANETAAFRIQEQNRKNAKRKQQLLPVFVTKPGDSKGWFLNKENNCYGWFETINSEMIMKYGPFKLKALIAAIKESKSKKNAGEHNPSVLLRTIKQDRAIFVDDLFNVSDAESSAASCIQERSRRKRNRQQNMVPLFQTQAGDTEGWFKVNELFAWFETNGGERTIKFGPFEPTALIHAMHNSKLRKNDQKADIFVRVAPVKGSGEIAFVDYTGRIRNVDAVKEGPILTEEQQRHVAAKCIQRKFRKHLLVKDGLMIPIFGSVQG